MIMMHALLRDAAADDRGNDVGVSYRGDTCDCPLVAAVSQVRPLTPPSVQGILRLAELLVHVSPARPSLARLLSSAVWEEVCGMTLPLAGVRWGRGVVDTGASLLQKGALPSGRL